MRFQVPQFIEVEDKMFGPLSFKQFIYVAGGLGFAGALYALYGFFISALLGGPMIGLALALAFFNYNGRPFIASLESIVNYVFKRKLYLWKKAEHEKKSALSSASGQAVIKPYVPRVSESKLKELAWSLDIKESLYSEGGAQQHKGQLESILGSISGSSATKIPDDRDTIHFERRTQ